MISISVNGHQYPPIEASLVNNNLANATDVVTLDNTLYTDFDNNTYNSWTLTYDSLTEAEYNVIRADYDAQFADLEYPLVDIPYYGLSSQPCRMYINEKNIYNNCGSIENLEITFRETAQLPEVS